MFTPPDSVSPNGLDADQDAAQLLRQLGASLLGIALVLTAALFLQDGVVRPATLTAIAVALMVLALVHFGWLRAASHVLCWGLLLSGTVGVYLFGLRSTGAIVLPLAIMSGGWLLGRSSAIALAAAASLVSLWVFVEFMQGNVRSFPPTMQADALAHVAIFSTTALLATAMAATLRRQYTKVSCLAKGLQEANATLENRVAERTAQLVAMQQEVLDAEKLVALGAMVAGISHELNTPLGNALTLSTTMQATVQTLAQTIASESLTRSELSGFLTKASEMSALTTRSVKKAADLVSSFKQVVADQTSEQRRTFLLEQVIADNLAALKPSFGDAPIVVTVDVPSDVCCDSYPGPLGQVFTNLLQNAVVHGVAGLPEGRITVSAQAQGDLIVLEVIDNGPGMAPQVLARAFDPFFTTRLGKGGSGLGLSVSQRIATSVLGGSLTARTQPGQGSRFTLTFPKQLPGGL